jgi:hypothetical protein
MRFLSYKVLKGTNPNLQNKSPLYRYLVKSQVSFYRLLFLYNRSRASGESFRMAEGAIGVMVS